MRLFGGLLPWMGWKKLHPDVVAVLAEVWDDIKVGKQYSAFSVEWLGIGRAWDIQESGPRDDEREV